MRAAHGRRAEETIRQVAPLLNAADEALALGARESNTAEGVYTVPGASELLCKLPPDSWAIVTSGLRDVAEFRLKITGLPLPNVMVCGDDVSTGKPDPACYIAGAMQLGVLPRECVVVEDAPSGIAAALAAGMRVLAVTATYAAEELLAATHVVGSLQQLRIQSQADHLRIHVRSPS